MHIWLCVLIIPSSEQDAQSESHKRVANNVEALCKGVHSHSSLRFSVRRLPSEGQVAFRKRDFRNESLSGWSIWYWKIEWTFFTVAPLAFARLKASGLARNLAETLAMCSSSKESFFNSSVCVGVYEAALYVPRLRAAELDCIGWYISSSDVPSVGTMRRLTSLTNSSKDHSFYLSLFGSSLFDTVTEIWKKLPISVVAIFL